MDDLTQFQEMIVAALGKAGDDLKKKIEDAVSGGSVDAGLRGLRNELRKLDKLAGALRQLDKVRYGTPMTAPEKREQRVVSGLARQRQREEESADDQRDRVLNSLGRQRRTEEAAYRRRRRRVMARLRARRERLDRLNRPPAEDDDGIHMGRLPIASIPAAIFGNKAAGARVGYALGERSGFGRWAGLAAGAGTAGVLGAGFAASPNGADVITKPLTILAAVIGAVVLPALVNFGAALLTVADSIRGKLPDSLTGAGVTAAVGFGALKALKGGVSGAGLVGAADLIGAGGMGAMGLGAAAKAAGGAGLSAVGGVLAAGARFAGPIAGALTAADMAAGLFGAGSTAGRTGGQKTLQYGGAAAGAAAGAALGSIIPGIGTLVGAGIGGGIGWIGGNWLGGDTPESDTHPKRPSFSENKKAILDAMVSAMGTPKMGNDFEQMNRDIQMATMQSELDARLLRVMQEAMDPMLREQRETNNLLRPK